ncbi:BamA/TamA family outer membrane protein [candidate division KSB1 bacterium]|nr:BamA/TamA family outer membrane protein [candidate division KSB1 bacterium]
MQQNARQMLFFILIALFFFLLFSGLIISNVNGSPGNKSMQSRFNGQNVKEIQRINRFNSDVTISEREKLRGDVLLENGDLVISGEIDGDVFVFNGNVILKRNATVYGHIIVYEGSIVKNSDCQIGGDLLEVYHGRTRYTKRQDISGERKKLYHFTKKRQVDPRETIDGNLVVQQGDLSIYGAVNGDVIAIDGDIKLGNNALVAGHIISGNGNIYITNGGRYFGEMIDLDFKYKNEDLSWKDLSNKLEGLDARIRSKIEKRYLNQEKKKFEGIFQFFGDVTVKENEIIDGDVVALKGTVAVHGEVRGDVVAIMGDVEMGNRSMVDGDVVSVGGKVFRNSGSRITGDVIATSLTGVRITKESDVDRDLRKDLERERERESKLEEREQIRIDRHEDLEREPNWERIRTKKHSNEFNAEQAFMFRYNRVEGMFLGLRVPKDYTWTPSEYHFSVFGHVGYGFANKSVRYHVGLERWFFDNLRFTVGAQAYNLTESQDEWQIPEFENTLSALLLKEDYLDFCRREGYSAYARQNLTRSFSVGAEYRIDSYYNMTRQTQWSLFGGHKRFTQNPGIDELIELKSLIARLTLDTRNHHRHPSRGWLISFEGQLVGPDLKNEIFMPGTNEVVNFDRYILDVRRYQPIGYGENLDFRIRAGSARGLLPKQFLFDMGGLSSLQGHDYKYFQNGDRMVLANVEYRIRGRRAGLSDILWLRHLNLILFVDAGLLWNSDIKNSYQEGFDGLTWTDLKTDIGIALTNYEGDVRLNIAKRTDVGGQPVVVTFRLNRTF